MAADQTVVPNMTYESQAMVTQIKPEQDFYQDSYLNPNLTLPADHCYQPDHSGASTYPQDDPESFTVEHNMDSKMSISPGPKFHPLESTLQSADSNGNSLESTYSLGSDFPLGPNLQQPLDLNVQQPLDPHMVQQMTQAGPMPSYADLDNYCNYLQSFLKPLETFGNPYASNHVERPISPMTDDYTIQDLSTKPSPSSFTSPATAHPFPLTDNLLPLVTKSESPPAETTPTRGYIVPQVGGGDSPQTGYMVPQVSANDSPQSRYMVPLGAGGDTSPKTNMGYMCDICKEGFRTAKGLNTHRAAIHAENGGERMFACKFCVKKFNTPGHLSRHEERHFQRINMTCFLCESHFKTISNFKFHLFSTHIMTPDHTAVFDFKLESNLEPLLLETTFIRIEMDGALTDEDLKIHVKGQLSDHIKLYQSHFNSVVNSTPFVQVIFHRECLKIMTVSHITSDHFTLTSVDQAQALAESRLAKKEGKVVGFEVAVIAKLCVFRINQEPMVIMRDGTSSVTISIHDVKIVA